MCRELLALRGKEPTNCRECLPPLMEENRDAVMIYLRCRKQLIFAGMGEPVDINHGAVHQAMRLYRVKDKVECFEKVLELSDHMLELWKQDQQGSDGLEFG